MTTSWPAGGWPSSSSRLPVNSSSGATSIFLRDGSVYVGWPPPPPEPPPERKPKKPKSSADEKHTIFGAVYANKLARAPMLSDSLPRFPVGSVIVRERLLESAAAEPDRLVVMIKRAKGFNSKANDWEFLQVSGDGKKIERREKQGACLQCHKERSTEDFVFRNYPK